MSLRDILNNAGAYQVIPRGGVTTQPITLTPTDTAALLGNKSDNSLIVKAQPLSGPGVLRNQALHTPEDQWAIKLGRERTRIDREASALKAQQDAKRGELQKALDAATAERTKAESDIHAELLALKPFMQSLRLQSPNSVQAGAQYDALMARVDLLNQGLNNLDATYTAGAQSALDDFNTSAQAEYDKIVGPMETNYKGAVDAAITLRDNAKKQSQFDDAYKAARAEYDNAVTQHDKDYAAFKMYQAKKAMYDQDSANRQADIDAGRYAVNPYQFMAQGAGLNEIEELREQVNAGNVRPNMRVPDAEVAPEEVKDPGEFHSDAPVHEHVEAPKLSTEVSGILGWTAPTTPPPADPELAKPSTAAVDTSSVHSDYVSPADKNKKPEPEKDANGNPIAQPTGAGTLQQTSSSAGNTSPTQQTATEAATPAPALAPQPTGSTGGQTNTTGQNQAAPTPPKPEEKPAPFTPDEEKKEEQDSVF